MGGAALRIIGIGVVLIALGFSMRGAQSPTVAAVGIGAGAEADRYLDFVSHAFRSYDHVRSHGDLVTNCGLPHLEEVTDRPEWKALDLQNPLTPDFDQRVYQFMIPNVGPGGMDVVFRGPMLVNVRAQLTFLKGGPSIAQRFLTDRLTPHMRALIGAPVEEGEDWSKYSSGNVVAVARCVPDTAAVSVYLMHAAYV